MWGPHGCITELDARVGGMTNVLTLAVRRVPVITWKKRLLFFRRAEETVEVDLDFVSDGKSLGAWIQEWEGADRVARERFTGRLA